MFLIAGIIIVLYFILLHTLIDSWDRIRRWFIKRARKRGSIEKLTLEDIKYLLIYTRKVFKVKASTTADAKKKLDVEKLKSNLLKNKRWKFTLNIAIIIELALITTGGIIGYMLEIDILAWMLFNWYYIFILFIPIIVILIGTYNSRMKIKETINKIPAESFEKVLLILNEFKIFGGKE